LEAPLQELLPEVGCELAIGQSKQQSKSLFGFGITNRDGHLAVNIAPDSHAENVLSLGSQIVTINETPAAQDFNHLIIEKEVEIDLIRQ